MKTNSMVTQLPHYDQITWHITAENFALEKHYIFHKQFNKRNYFMGPGDGWGVQKEIICFYFALEINSNFYSNLQQILAH